VTCEQDRNSRLRQILRPYRAKADVFALGLFAADCAMYAVCTALAAAHLPIALRFVAGLAAGVLLAVLFVVGHDACHGSYTSRRWLNAAIGRIAFLPTMTPYNASELSHNLTHQLYTNLKPGHYLLAPLSKNEYDPLPAWRKNV